MLNFQTVAEIVPSVGMSVKPDTWGIGFCSLIESDWDAAPLRVRTYQPVIESLAVRIEITGRKVFAEGPGANIIRCRVVFVGDGEADQSVGGWLNVGEHWFGERH